VARLHGEAEEGGEEEPPTSTFAPRAPSLRPQHLGGRTSGGQPEEEEEESAGSGEQQEAEGGLVVVNMNIDSPPLDSVVNNPQTLLFGLPTPTPPPTTSTTPRLSQEDPIGDALTTIFQHMTGQTVTTQEGSDHTPLTSEGWYEFHPGDAHVWMDVPLHPNPDNEKK